MRDLGGGSNDLPQHSGISHRCLGEIRGRMKHSVGMFNTVWPERTEKGGIRPVPGDAGA